MEKMGKFDKHYLLGMHRNVKAMHSVFSSNKGSLHKYINHRNSYTCPFFVKYKSKWHTERLLKLIKR